MKNIIEAKTDDLTFNSTVFCVFTLCVKSIGASKNCHSRHFKVTDDLKMASQEKFIRFLEVTYK